MLILRLGVARGSSRGPLTCSRGWTWPGPLKHRGARVVGSVRATIRPTTARLLTELINTKRNDRLCLSHLLTLSMSCCMQYVGTQNLYSTLPRGAPILTTSARLRVLAAVQRRPLVRSSVKANKMGASEYVWRGSALYATLWPAARCPLPAARCPLPAARCPLPAARSASPNTCSSTIPPSTETTSQPSNRSTFRLAPESEA
jgi:hypothetical protein